MNRGIWNKKRCDERCSELIHFELTWGLDVCMSNIALMHLYSLANGTISSRDACMHTNRTTRGIAWAASLITSGHVAGSVWFCSALANNDTLTDYYGVKQSQFTKPIPEPRASDPEKFNEAFERAIRGWQCSITVANHQLITVIRFVAKNYTHP